MDRYAYTLNNPVLYKDPSGHDVDCGLGDTSSYCFNRSRVKQLWDSKQPCYCDKKAAEAAYLHFLDDPTSFFEQYVNPKLQDKEYADLEVFAMYSNLHMASADQLIWNMTADAFGLDFANSMYDARSRNIWGSLTGDTNIDFGTVAAAATVIVTNKGTFEFSGHFEERMVDRGLSVDQVQAVINNSKTFDYWHNGQLKQGWYDSGQKIFVGATDDGVINTVMTNVSGQYIGDLRNKQP